MSDSNSLQQALRQAAYKVQTRAYAPYSNFKVGAAILADDGQTYTGCNVENAAYPQGVCAEAGAISAMIATGANKIKEIMIASPTNRICAPCGGCRQKILEFSTPDTVVHMANTEGEIKTMKFSELLPLTFDADDIR